VWSASRLVVARATGVFRSVPIAISRKFVRKLLMLGELGFGSAICTPSFGGGCFMCLLRMLCAGDAS
jgi:hypothetical protein